MLETDQNLSWLPAICPTCGSDDAVGKYLRKKIVHYPEIGGPGATRLIFDWRCICHACKQSGDFHGARWLAYK